MLRKRYSAGMFWRRKPADTTPTFLKLDGSNAFRIRIKTAKRGEVVELRITKSGDISPQDGGGHFVRKQVIGPQTFDRATLEITWGPNYTRPNVHVTNGEAIPVAAWD
jgi:hypothetical protein